jgi:hypothetical protein
MMEYMLENFDLIIRSSSFLQTFLNKLSKEKKNIYGQVFQKTPSGTKKLHSVF